MELNKIYIKKKPEMKIQNKIHKETLDDGLSVSNIY